MTTRGKYQDLCDDIKNRTDADGVLVAVYGGELGNGFSVVGSPEFCRALPMALRLMADQLEADERSLRNQLI